mgnify:FL=1
MLIGVLVSINLSSCGSNDDEPQLPSEDEIYKMWLEEATSEYDVVKDQMAYNIYDGKAMLHSVNPAISGAISIPSEVYYEGTGKNYPVTYVEFNPDITFSKVTSLSIPSSVEDCRIGYLSITKTLSIPSSVTYLEIYDCPELTTVSLAEGADNFGITNCPNITSLTIPQSTKQFRLKKLSIKEITVPTGIEFVEFQECGKLEKVNNLENSSLKVLGSRAFYNCTALKELYLPKTTSSITYGCCEGATSLNKVHCLRTTPPSLKDSKYGEPFSVMDNLYVPKGCKDAYKEVYPWNQFKEIIEE